ncbi:MAG: GNAT family N-acetyltransferase [Armatimonadetes bacterium]|nr:GNAT family N-acetyltransferase [Armatimonadota bacterium]
MNYWQGKKVRLRGVEPSDAEIFFQWNQDSEMGRNLEFLWPPISRELVRKQVEEMALRTMEQDRFRWVIEDASGMPVGQIDTHHCDSRTGNFSYGLNIAPEHQRQGYASEAIRMILRYYFEEIRYHKATVEILSHNHASIALHERLGFMQEGRLRDMVFTGGRYYDLLYYGMTRKEWDGLAGRMNEEDAE